MGWFGESTAHKQARYQKEANEQLQGYNLENMEIQQGYNIENMQRQFEYEQQNMANQFAYQKEAFNLENAYNTPSAQRMRMQAAGLNPNWSDTAAIGQMDAGVNPVAPVGGSPSGGASGSASPPSLTGTAEMKDIIGMLISKKQADLMQSEIDLNKTKQAKELSDTQLNEVEIKERPSNYASHRQLQEYQGLLNRSQKITIDKTNEWIETDKLSNLAKILADTDLSKAKQKEILDTLEFDIKEIVSRTAKNYSDVAMNQSNIKRNSAEVAQQWQQLALNARQVQINAQDVAIKDKAVNEMIRNNKYNNFVAGYVAQAEVAYKKSLSRYFEAGHKLISAQNVYQDIENEFRRYLRVNHIDSESADMALRRSYADYLGQIDQNWLTQEEAEYAGLRAMTGILGILGLSSTLGKKTGGTPYPGYNKGVLGSTPMYVNP